MKKIGDTLCLVLTAAQVFAIVGARFSKCRYFAWVPSDEILEHEIEVFERNRRWTPDEFARRFAMEPRGRENRCAEHLFRYLRKSMESQGPGDLRVEVRSSLNGRPSQITTLRCRQASVHGVSHANSGRD